jgi:hypothetical protein
MVGLLSEVCAMLNLELITRRLGHYGAAWLLSFLLVFLGGLGLSLLLHLDLITVADRLLAVAFVGLITGLAAFLAMTLFAAETWQTKSVLIVLGVLLLLPLLWAPVLALIACAWIAHVPIEYSGVYAGFRIVVGRLLFDLTELIFGNPLVETAWSFFQGLATVVGFFSALAQIWTFLQKLSARRSPA